MPVFRGSWNIFAVIEFEDGIPGFENLKKYVIVEEVDTNLSYLQCVTDGSLAYAIINP